MSFRGTARDCRGRGHFCHCSCGRWHGGRGHVLAGQRGRSALKNDRFKTGRIYTFELSEIEWDDPNQNMKITRTFGNCWMAPTRMGELQGFQNQSSLPPFLVSSVRDTRWALASPRHKKSW